MAQVVVIGAGFGGLSAALELSRRRVEVVLFERHTAPGGCAGTFVRAGCRFEAGATLLSGLGEGRLLDRVIRDHGLDVSVDLPEELVTLRTPELELAVPADRRELADRIAASDRPRERPLRAFLAHQTRVADALWPVFDRPELLPPFSGGGLLRAVPLAPAFTRLLPLVGRPLGRVVERHGVGGSRPLRTYLDAVCQITVQAGVDEAEAPLAMAAVDYFSRGAGHVRGGIGELARAMTDAIRRRGGEVRLGEGVDTVRRNGDRWRVHTTSGQTVDATAVVANVLPHDARRLAGLEPGESPTLDRVERGLEEGWGAAMLYLIVDPERLSRPAPFHLQLVLDPTRPFIEGNHLFCSVGTAAKGDGGLLGATVSTHVRMRDHLARGREAQQEALEAIQRRMLDGLAELAPELSAAVVDHFSAGPATFERFTGRRHGLVGGAPRRAGWHNYLRVGLLEPLPGLVLVGDSVPPGQSVLATTIGGLKAASAIVKKL